MTTRPSPTVLAAPLAWTEPSTGTNGCWTAQTPLGAFSIAFDDGWHASLEDGALWEWEPEEDPRSYHGPNAAMAACQAYVQSIVDQLIGEGAGGDMSAAAETRIAVDAAKDALRLVSRVPDKIGRPLAKRAEDALLQLNFVFPSGDASRSAG